MSSKRDMSDSEEIFYDCSEDTQEDKTIDLNQSTGKDQYSTLVDKNHKETRSRDPQRELGEIEKHKEDDIKVPEGSEAACATKRNDGQTAMFSNNQYVSSESKRKNEQGISSTEPKTKTDDDDINVEEVIRDVLREDSETATADDNNPNQTNTPTNADGSSGIKNDEDISSSESEEELSEEDLMERKTAVDDIKRKGNEMFKSDLYDEARDMYTKGLKVCPKCLKKERSIFYSNISACLMKMNKPEEAIEYCDQALNLHPTYLKALLRRAQLYEDVKKLDDALKDYQAVLEMDPSVHSARAACMRLPDQINDRNEKLKEEMMSKLKDLGNVILRPFGLSTDQFNFQQNPDTGSYNVQFNNNPNS